MFRKTDYAIALRPSTLNQFAYQSGIQFDPTSLLAQTLKREAIRHLLYLPPHDDIPQGFAQIIQQLLQQYRQL